MEIIYTKTGRMIRHLKTPTGILEVFEPLQSLQDRLAQELIIKEEVIERINSLINEIEKVNQTQTDLHHGKN